jgi:hypothetical protein
LSAKTVKGEPALGPTVADEDEELAFDADSTYGAYSDITDTASVTSSIMKFREENGRTYHSYGSPTD